MSSSLKTAAVHQPRPDWDEYFMEIARTVATRATCPRAHVGAVVVKDRRILTTGYNGAPPETSHCSDAGCLMVDNHCLRATHAEANAIVQGARHGVGLTGATLYTTHRPCAGCAKLVISAGITRVIYEHSYLDPVAETLFGEARIEVVRNDQTAGIGQAASEERYLASPTARVVRDAKESAPL